ncbi:hypothetical protein FQR65_LT08507 [Abscondita terminalis]|nr:hypothetical protein FQR65_LT08507 [Abscondita terminalis]
MPPVFTCCVVNCDADAKSTRKHRFPKDPECSLESGLNLVNVQISKTWMSRKCEIIIYRICDYHFAPEYMVGVQHIGPCHCSYTIIKFFIICRIRYDILFKSYKYIIYTDEPVSFTMESISSPRPQFDFEVVAGPSHEHKHLDLLDKPQMLELAEIQNNLLLSILATLEIVIDVKIVISCKNVFAKLELLGLDNETTWSSKPVVNLMSYY